MTELPESIVHYVVRTQESVILDDASVLNLVLRGQVHPSASRPFYSLPAAAQPDETHRRALP